LPDSFASTIPRQATRRCVRWQQKGPPENAGSAGV
jgi:hypothetical protein